MPFREVANPYRPGEPVEDPAMLFGRQDAADWLELQISGNARVVLFGGSPLIGKSSFVKHAGSLHNLQALNLLVSVAEQPASGNGESSELADVTPPTINSVLQSVIDQLMPQMTLFNLAPTTPLERTSQPASLLRMLFSFANQRLGPERLVLYLDDLDRIFAEDMAVIAGFLSSLLPLLDECPHLHLVFALNQDKLKRIEHPLLDGAPTFTLGPLAGDEALNMVTLPVKDILRFDYGVTKRIVEVNSHHPYYLSLFCHTLLNRQVHDGWVNQRDFDAALAEILDSPIAPFNQIWDRSSWVERTVLSGMAAIQGTHGPLTHQEITRFLQRHHNGVTSPVVVDSLETLAGRGVLVPMGAISYRFHVELLRLWLREHTSLPEIIQEVHWDREVARIKAKPAREKAITPPIARPSRDKGRRRSTLFWVAIMGGVALLCLLSLGAGLAIQALDLGLPFTAPEEPTATVVALAPTPDSPASPAAPAATVPAELPPTPTPTPPLVVARTLPSITFMGRDIDQSWRIYVMNADGSEVNALSPEGVEDTAPIWSPDGQKIAFVSQRDGNREIYVMDADGQNAVNITRHPADDWTPSWSPDGTRLAFSSFRTGGWEIFVVELDCLPAPETCPDRLTQITFDDNANILPVWSPDGSRFAFNSKASGNWDIYTMAVNGADVRQVTTDPENDLSPTWSPDGTQIAFESNRDGNVEVYVVNADGSGAPRNVSNLSWANDHGPAWTPDGQQLIFYSNREGNWDLFATSLDGQTVVNLTQTPERDEQTPAWRP